jgi:hypothetical protein
MNTAALVAGALEPRELLAITETVSGLPTSADIGT